MVNFAASAATAKRLVEANGRAVTLRRRNTTANDPSKPWRGPTEAISNPAGGDTEAAIACFVPPSGSGLGAMIAGLKGDTTVPMAEQVALIAADTIPGVDVSTYDAITDSGTVWQILRVDRLQPATQVVLWTVYVKR